MTYMLRHDVVPLSTSNVLQILNIHWSRVSQVHLEWVQDKVETPHLTKPVEDVDNRGCSCLVGAEEVDVCLLRTCGIWCSVGHLIPLFREHLRRRWGWYLLKFRICKLYSSRRFKNRKRTVATLPIYLLRFIDIGFSRFYRLNTWHLYLRGYWQAEHAQVNSVGEDEAYWEDKPLPLELHLTMVGSQWFCWKFFLNNSIQLSSRDLWLIARTKVLIDS